MSKSFANSRRDFVKLASGAAVSPFLTLPSRNLLAQSRPNLRFLVCIDTYGLSADKRGGQFVRSTSGDYALKASDLGSTLRPLEGYVENMLIPSNISLDSRAAASDAATHHFLTTQTLNGSAALSESRGDEVNQAVRHSSLDVRIGDYLHNEYGLSSPRIYDHLLLTDYAQRGSATFSYTDDGKQKRSIAGTASVRDALFSNVDTSNQGLNLVNSAARLDAITLVQERLDALSGRLTNANQGEVLEAYQESIDSVSRELELKNENVISIPAELLSLQNGNGSNKNNPNDTPDMFKNIYHAFAFDIVSSVTYVFGGEKINQQRHAYLYSESEHNDSDLEGLLNTNLHAASHRNDDVASRVHELVRTYQAEELAKLLDRLSTTVDSDGSMVLDNTVVFFTSQMSNNTHKTSNYPHFIIAGKNTNLQGGFHYDCDDSTNNDLLTTLAQGLTLPDDNFGGHGRDGNYISSLNNGPISRMLKS